MASQVVKAKIIGSPFELQVPREPLSEVYGKIRALAAPVFSAYPALPQRIRIEGLRVDRLDPYEGPMDEFKALSYLLLESTDAPRS
jgi:hypothetical protein